MSEVAIRRHVFGRLLPDVIDYVEDGGQVMAERNGTYKMPDDIWKRIEPLLPPQLPDSEVGKSQIGSRQAMEAILCRLCTDCGRGSLPRDLGLSSAVYSRFEEWRDAGVFQRMWKAGLLEYGELRALFWNGRWHMKRR